jgi:alpha-ketoglutarate-dependent taurine dioxygenase
VSVRVEPIKEHIGAIVEVDKARLGDPDVADAVQAALEKHGVLVFPKIGVTDEEQLRFTDSLGQRLDFTSKVDMGKGSEVYRVTLDPKINRQKEYVHGTYFWHMDGLTVPEQPPKATMLSGRKLADKGGDTHFCSSYAAHSTLPDELKEQIEALRVVHNLTPYLAAIIENPTEEELERWNASPVNEYPLVWTHENGRKSLVMGYTAHHIAGMELATGRALLAQLLEWAAQPDLSYVHKWQQGDLVLWDNYGTLHRATPYTAASGREMHRTTIVGTELLH